MVNGSIYLQINLSILHCFIKRYFSIIWVISSCLVENKINVRYIYRCIIPSNELIRINIFPIIFVYIIMISLCYTTTTHQFNGHTTMTSVKKTFVTKVIVVWPLNWWVDIVYGDAMIRVDERPTRISFEIVMTFSYFILMNYYWIN